ncbi:MAG: class I SAM-dependent methyltransferase [Pyrinomonadaceae bacterium]
MRIIIGANGTQQPGWRSLEKNELDIRSGKQWLDSFPVNSLDAILAEHVFEHLTALEAYAALRNCYRHLKPGGYLRIAVPDGLHPDKVYLDWVAPNSPGEKFLSLFRGEGEPNHKVLWNYRSLIAVLSAIGFRVRLLEWIDERGLLHRNAWRASEGEIRRSYEHSYTRGFLNLIVGTEYTSLIVDGVKR